MLCSNWMVGFLKKEISGDLLLEKQRMVIRGNFVKTLFSFLVGNFANIIFSLHRQKFKKTKIDFEKR
jgi:hypothetical protein